MIVGDLSRRALLTSLAAAFVHQSLPGAAHAAPSYARATDETDLSFDGEPLGLKLIDVRVFLDPSKQIDGSSRVVLADVLPDGQAARRGLHTDEIIVAVDGVNVELENAETVQQKIEDARRRGHFTLTIKDPNQFQYALLDPPPGGATEICVSTALTPSADGKPVQLLGVRRREVPSGGCRRPAAVGDLIEIFYEGRVAEGGALFDGMDLAQRQGDATIQFVLGKQPAGQFPPSWDVGLVGMCIGEERTLDVPPVLGFGTKGMPKRGVPPDAALRYKVGLVSINGLAMD